MNDYTLPPLPHHPFANSLSERWSEMEEVAIARYGHACAEHVRAPLLARVAELEALVELYRKQGADQDARAWLAMSSECQARGEVIDRLRADLAREQKRRREIDDEAFEYAEQVESLRAEVEALLAKIDRAEVSYGNMVYADDKRPAGTTDYTRGWGDCLRAIAARKGEGSEE